MRIIAQDKCGTFSIIRLVDVVFGAECWMFGIRSPQYFLILISQIYLQAFIVDNVR